MLLKRHSSPMKVKYSTQRLFLEYQSSKTRWIKAFDGDKLAFDATVYLKLHNPLLNMEE